VREERGSRGAIRVQQRDARWGSGSRKKEMLQEEEKSGRKTAIRTKGGVVQYSAECAPANTMPVMAEGNSLGGGRGKTGLPKPGPGRMAGTDYAHLGYICLRGSARSKHKADAQIWLIKETNHDNKVEKGLMQTWARYETCICGRRGKRVGGQHSDSEGTRKTSKFPGITRSKKQ